MLLLRSEDVPEITENLKKPRNSCTCTDTQNELLQLLSMQVQKVIASQLKEAEFIAIMLDETPDQSNKEQCVLVIRHCDDDLDVREEFIGLYHIHDTKADTLVKVTDDVLTRLNISFSKVRGQCYDGASTLGGVQNGVAKQIREKEDRALYTHCYGHSLNLACSDAFKDNKIMKDAMDFAKEIIKLIKRSPKRDLLFQQV